MKGAVCVVPALEEILAATKSMVFFGGAGVSTESGIPDFRSVASGLDSMNRPFGLHTAADDEALTNALELVGLSQLQHSGIGEVSGGQLQRALLARAIIGQREVLVLDEPLSYIDKEFEPKFYEIINQLKEHTTMLLVSHEMTAISQMANRHIIVDGGVHECHAQHHFVQTQCR